MCPQFNKIAINKICDVKSVKIDLVVSRDFSIKMTYHAMRLECTTAAAGSKSALVANSSSNLQQKNIIVIRKYHLNEKSKDNIDISLETYAWFVCMY